MAKIMKFVVGINSCLKWLTFLGMDTVINYKFCLTIYSVCHDCVVVRKEGLNTIRTVGSRD